MASGDKHIIYLNIKLLQSPLIDIDADYNYQLIKDNKFQFKYFKEGKHGYFKR